MAFVALEQMYFETDGDSTASEVALEQINFEMRSISKFSFSQKSDLRLNPRHVVARCTFVQR